MAKNVSKKATAADADLILKLYDLRREPKMREAREYMAQRFLPATFDEFMFIVKGMGTDENRHFRQTLTYWDMAASLVVHGALNEQLFIANAGEMFLFYTKCRPYIERVRKETGNPNFLRFMEQVAEGSKEGRARVAFFTDRIASMLKAQKAAK